MPRAAEVKTAREVELEEMVALLRQALEHVPPPHVIQHDGFRRWWLDEREPALQVTT